MSGLPALYGLGALGNVGANMLAGSQGANNSNAYAGYLNDFDRLRNVSPYAGTKFEPVPPHIARIKRMTDWLETQMTTTNSQE